uniref:Uncharacterized protein n=1 Tax=Romanomermis culicivorax TaxID=13658 RepID=A0A915K9D9_ROMCU
MLARFKVVRYVTLFFTLYFCALLPKTLSVPVLPSSAEQIVLDKKPFDRMDSYAFGGLHKRPFDRFDTGSLSSFNKRTFDRMDQSFFGGFNKRRFDALDSNPFHSF